MKQTKTARLFDTLKRRWITPDDAYQLFGIRNCLSQRVGDFRRAGHNVIDKWIKDANGRNVCKAYRIVRG